MRSSYQCMLSQLAIDCSMRLALASRPLHVAFCNACPRGTSGDRHNKYDNNMNLHCRC